MILHIGNDIELEYKFTFRSDLIYENIMNESFKGDTEQSWIVMFYSTYLALSNNFDMTLEDFIEKLDEKPESLYEFVAYYSKVMTNQMNLIPKDKEQDSKKKVKKQTKQKK